MMAPTRPPISFAWLAMRRWRTASAIGGSASGGVNRDGFETARVSSACWRGPFCFDVLTHARSSAHETNTLPFMI
jgi:hypothetical protein